MSMSNSNDDFDLYLVREFFDEEACRELIREMRSSPANAAITYGQESAGGVINENVRRVSRVQPSAETVALVTERLMEQLASVAEHFLVALSRCEEPQFLCYRPGDFFVAHQDGNTGLVNLDTDRFRRVSVSVFLNQQSEAPQHNSFCGGSLRFTDWRKGRSLSSKAKAGMLVAFRSETTHEVTPITHGERYSIVSWYG
jgi:predicted 2-oxoglutarate/Fe(II)-dependent dioxygenase YbiX